MSFYWYLCVLFLLSSSSGTSLEDNLPETENQIRALRKELLKNRAYDPMTRPVRNYTHTVNVTIDFTLIHIDHLNMETNILSSVGWIILQWLDENLTWKPADYGGVDEIHVRVDEVYRPDITLVNSVGSENIIKTSTHSDMILRYDGTLVWVPVLAMETICEADLTEWPFDMQTCQYRFLSWTYDSSGLNLVNSSDKISLEDLWDSHEWRVVDTSCKYIRHEYMAVEEVYPEVSYVLVMERKNSVYRYTVYLPILCALALNLMTLFLDVHNRLRLYLSSLSFLTLLLLVLHLGNRLGFGSLGKPKVVIYLGQMIVLIGITMLWSAFAYNFARSTFEVPHQVLGLVQSAHQWLVIRDAEAVRLTEESTLESGLIEEEAGPPEVGPGSKGVTVKDNLMVIQVVDKVLLVIFFLLIVGLHN